MQSTQEVATKDRIRFCLVFGILWIATLFVPIFPIFDSAAIYRPSDVIQSVLPVWAVYYRAYYLFDPAFILWPIVISHGLFCFCVGRGLTGNQDLPTQYSLLGMLSVSSGFAICIACLLAKGAIGFSTIFVVGLSGLILASVIPVASIFGIPLYHFDRPGLILSITLCIVLAASGATIIFGSAGNGWILP